MYLFKLLNSNNSGAVADKLLCCLFLSFLLFLTMACAKADDPVALALPRLESLIHQSMPQKNIPGLAVAVVSKGKVIYIKGFGVRTIGHPAPIDFKTLFQIGSVSKAISSTLVAILNREQKGRLLDYPIEFIPGTTLRHILSHTTGVPSAGFNALIERGVSPLEMRERLQRATLQGNPGEKFMYHNAVYNLLTHVVESHSHASFESILQAKLLQPLSMARTSSTWKTFISEENRSSAHVLRKIRGKKGKTIKTTVKQAPYRKEYANFPAAGGVSSNIQDMAYFLAAVMGFRPDVVSPEDLEEVTHPIVHTPDQWHRTQKHRDRITETRYGLGWRHMVFGGHPVVFHGGWLRGFSTILAFLPEQQVGIVVLQNVESGLGFQISMQFFDWVLGLPPKKWIG